MGWFFNFDFAMKWVFLAKSIDRRARGRGSLPGSSIACKWSRYNLCDTVTKASVALYFVASTALDVHFKCYISADAKIQAPIKHGKEVKPIHRTTWLHSSLPCSFRGTWRSLFSAINWQVFVVIVFEIRAHSTQVPRSHQASSSTVFSCQMKTYDFHLLLVFLWSAGECTEGTYHDDDYG